MKKEILGKEKRFFQKAGLEITNAMQNRNCKCITNCVGIS